MATNRGIIWHSRHGRHRRVAPQWRRLASPRTDWSSRIEAAIAQIFKSLFIWIYDLDVWNRTVDVHYSNTQTGNTSGVFLQKEVFFYAVQSKGSDGKPLIGCTDFFFRKTIWINIWYSLTITCEHFHIHYSSSKTNKQRPSFLCYQQRH